MTKEELTKKLQLHALWLQQKGEGTRLDLKGAHLSEADLRDADLSGANFRYADLQRTNLYLFPSLTLVTYPLDLS